MRIAKHLPLLLVVMLATQLHALTPSWLQEVARIPTPPSVSGAPALVLLDETRLTVDRNGTWTERHRFAIRILHLSARSQSYGEVYYNGKSDKLLKVGAWLIRNNKTVTNRPSDEWSDRVDDDPATPIEEIRKASTSVISWTVAGDVFGYETEVQRPILVSQYLHSFYTAYPTLANRLILQLPPQFSSQAIILGNTPPVEVKSADGLTRSWTVADQPFQPDEYYAAPGARRAATVMVNIAGPAPFSPLAFRTWAEVAAWTENLNRAQMDTSPELEEKARELLSGHDSPMERIRALCTYVQAIRYVAVNENLSKGMGYQARKASLVLKRAYGDCKDKANLLVTLLRQAGITAYSVSASWSREYPVSPDFPSPCQFNHAITAIVVPDSLDMPAVVHGTAHGSLLFFDPTHPFLELGDLPADLQGSRVLVIDSSFDSLVALPEIPAEKGFSIRRTCNLTASTSTAVAGQMEIVAQGAPASQLRQRLKAPNDPKALEKAARAQLNDVLPDITLTALAGTPLQDSGGAKLSFTASFSHHLQAMEGGNAFILRLDLLSHPEIPSPLDKSRLLPFDLPPACAEDEINVVIPAGLALDELPDSRRIHSPFGTYEQRLSSKGGVLQVKRSLTLRRQIVQTADYPKLKQFLMDVVRADKLSVLLRQAR